MRLADKEESRIVSLSLRTTTLGFFLTLDFYEGEKGREEGQGAKMEEGEKRKRRGENGRRRSEEGRRREMRERRHKKESCKNTVIHVPLPFFAGNILEKMMSNFAISCLRSPPRF